MTQPTRARSLARPPDERVTTGRCWSCDMGAATDPCAYCAAVGSSSPIADERKAGGLAALARASGVPERTLRRAATGETPLSLPQALDVAAELQCRPEDLSLKHAAARARARRAAARRKAGAA